MLYLVKLKFIGLKVMPIYGYCLSGSNDTKHDVIGKRKKIRAYALINDFEIEHIFIEKEGHQFKPFNKRPRGKKILNSLDGKSIVIADKLSDVFYSAQETLNTIQLFKKHNIDLHVIEIGGRLVTDNPNEISLLFIKRFADFEKDFKQGKKIKTVNNGFRKRGKIPFGFTMQDGELIENTQEQLIIRDMNEMHNNGKGYLAIAKIIVEKYNISFSHMGIKKILQRNSEIMKKQNDNNIKTS